MGSAATVMGVVQITTNRYMRHHYSWHQLVHSISGFIFFVVMLTGMIIMWNRVLGGFGHAFHPFSMFGWGGSIVVLVMCLGTGIGILAEYLRQYGKNSWGD